MPKLSTKSASRLRIEAICADRARGLTFREIARRHGVDVAYAHRCARAVDVVLVHRKWHLARWRKPDAPGPTVRQVHEHRAGSWAG